ncbi:MAG TPA: M23 family metallopeptidase [Vicinamibacteria bacterium]|nr:M23 family metallopeptidase [Vicinamibacteria bacterium]
MSGRRLEKRADARRARRLVPALVAAGLAAWAGVAPAAAEDVVRHVGRVTFKVDVSQAYPGGVVVVRLASRGRLGAAWAFLDGRRAPFYSDRGVPRALVPVAATTAAGPATLGVEIAARTGDQRIVIPLTIAGREYRARSVPLSEPKRVLLDRHDAAHDGRRLLALLRTESPQPAPGLLQPPVAATGTGFGEARSYSGRGDVESRTDSLQGERHRGLDYAVPAGTVVRAPAAGTVLHAGSLVLSGETVVIDHGQGVVSVLEHLSRVDVRAGDAVAGAAVVGSSGDTGLAPEPMLQWRVYLHGVAVDPTVLAAVL